MRFVVEGWFVIDLDDGGRVMDDRCDIREEAEEAAQEYGS